MNLYAAVIGVIVLVLLTVSLSRLGKVKTKADYLVAGRTLPAVVLVFTLLSSWIGSGSLLGGAENAYKHGFVALWQGGGGWVGLLLIYFIAPRARKFAQFTIPDLLETRYNQTARVLGVIAILLTYTAITSYQFIGGGDILHLIFPDVISPILGRYIIAAFVIVFTAIAGMSSVAYMDLFIGLLATVTMCLALPVLIHRAGGWGAVHAALPASHFTAFDDLSFIQCLELFLPTCLLLLGNQSMYQKFFSARSEKDARRAVVGWIIGTVILETVIVAIAVTGSALFPTGEVSNAPREILAYCGLHGFEGWLGIRAAASRRAADGGDLRENRVDREQLAIFASDEPGERHLCAVHQSAGFEQEDPDCEPVDGGSAGCVGAVPVAGDGVGAEEGTVCLHDLFGCPDAGDFGGVLLEASDCGGGGGEHCGGDGGDGFLGVGSSASAEGDGRARCDLSGADRVANLFVCSESGD